jgi:hypothetical protein
MPFDDGKTASVRNIMQKGIEARQKSAAKHRFLLWEGRFQLSF